MSEYLNNAVQVGGAAAVCVAAFLSAWQARRANKSATKAADNSHPISNGWGTALRNDMAAQREDMKATRHAMERMSEAQLLAERRELARDAALHEVRTLLSAHLSDHAREAHT